MTNTQFTKQLFTILDELLEAGITSCNIHQARERLDYLFDEYEEMDGVEKQYFHIIENGCTVLIDESECAFDEDTENDHD